MTAIIEDPVTTSFVSTLCGCDLQPEPCTNERLPGIDLCRECIPRCELGLTAAICCLKNMVSCALVVIDGEMIHVRDRSAADSFRDISRIF